MKIRTYKAQTKWIEGTKVETEIREFKVGIDRTIRIKRNKYRPQSGRDAISRLGRMCIVNISGICQEI